jgi:hypothetical protein
MLTNKLVRTGDGLPVMPQATSEVRALPHSAGDSIHTRYTTKRFVLAICVFEYRDATAVVE